MQVKHNEQLYALKYAPILSTKWSKADILQALQKGDNCDRMAIMAAKIENTKTKSKVKNLGLQTT
jgi:hypothetical protein